MYNDYDLSKDTQAILDEVITYERAKLHRFERKRELLRISKNAEGKYDFTRLIRGHMENDVRRIAPYEFSESEKIAAIVGRQPHPGYSFVSARDLTAGASGAGGYFVSTETAPGEIFTGYLQAARIISRMNITRIGLTGNAALPRVTGGISTSWLQTEGTQVTESQFTFGLAASTPKTVGAYCELSDTFLKSTSPAAQNFVIGEQARAVAAEADSKIINGSGASGQPLGILSSSGIGSVVGTSLTHSGTLDAVKAVEDANGIVSPESAGWVIASDAAKILRGRERATGSGFILNDNGIAGFRTLVSNSVPAGTAIFADWSSLLLIEWGILEVGADPYGVNSALFTKGLVGLRCLWTMDTVLLRPASFCKITGIT